MTVVSCRRTKAWSEVAVESPRQVDRTAKWIAVVAFRPWAVQTVTSLSAESQSTAGQTRTWWAFVVAEWCSPAVQKETFRTIAGYHLRRVDRTARWGWTVVVESSWQVGRTMMSH